MDVNVRGMWNLCRLVVPLMVAQGRGSVINMASVAGPFAVKERGVYSVSKAAVIGLTKSLAIDHVGQGIRVNAICPGTVETPSWHDRVNKAPNPDQALKDFIARQPMGRVGRPDEVASLAAFLASDESAYMTGQALYIDGGMSM
jgi:2-keto-3-deoxy-L-fuconate dehydrogenase